MRLVVQKFGGTSVANAQRIMAAARRAIRTKQAGNQVIVVVSARGDTTDELIELAKEISEQPPAREMDMLLATGEQISIALVAMAIQTLGERAISFTGAQVGIVTDSTHTKARIKSISTARMRQALTEGQIVIVAGFQGIDENYNITTLGRGGSDTTAVALAAVMKHSEVGVRGQGSGVSDNGGDHSGLTPDPCPLTPQDVGCEIYTDVDGVYTTDPRIVPEARKMDFISYDEMLELASVGAGVMHSRSIEFGKKFDVPIQVRSSFSDVEGTWIVPESEWMRDVVVCGAALGRDEARVSLNGVPDEPGISHRVFAAMADHNIVVDMIAQNVGSAGKAAIGFTVLGDELPAVLKVLRPLAGELGASIEFDEQVSKVSIVGTGMRTHTGVAERMFAALSAENVNMKMITTADIKISVLVSRNDGVKALRAVHQAFGLGQPPSAIGHRLSAFGQRPQPESRKPKAESRLAALDAAAGQHGGHRRQRRNADDRSGPHHHLRLAGSAGLLLARLPGGGRGRHRRGHDRAKPGGRPHGVVVQRAAGRSRSRRNRDARGRRRARSDDARRRRRRHRPPVRAWRRHAHAHRRRPPHVRRPGPARHQHQHD